MRTFYLIIIWLLPSKNIAQIENDIIKVKRELQISKIDSLRLEKLIAKGTYFHDISILDSAILYFEMAKVLATKKDYKQYYARICRKQSEVYFQKAIYPTALELQLEALNISTLIKDKKSIGLSYEAIGSIYSNINNTNEALKYFKLMYTLSSEINDSVGKFQAFNSLASVYSQLGKSDLAYIYFKKALVLGYELKNESGVNSVLANIGIILIDKKQEDAAIDTLKKVLKIQQQNNDEYMQSSLLLYIGQAYFNKGNLVEAKKNTLQALKLSKIAEEKDNLKETYFALSKIEYELKNYKAAYDYHVEFKALNDTIFNFENSKQLGDLRTNNEVEKKEAELKLKANAEKEKLLAISKQEKKQQTIIIISVIGVLIIVIIFALFLYQRFKITQKQKRIIELKEVETQKQKHLVEERNKEITDSINYAKRLQTAILPPIELIKKAIPNSFVYYKPKDIVAGDFYWFYDSSEYKTGNEGNKFILIAAADSTGHGVPGAMVSIVCSNALDKAVKEFGLSEPGEILDKTTELVLETFKKSGEVINDGMDISLLKIEYTDTEIIKSLKWSGANNSLLMISRTSKIAHEIKADKQPIGNADNLKPFTTHLIPLEKDMLFYLLTDGFADQFGGPQGKKYKLKQLQELLVANCLLDLHQQEALLNNEFTTWLGSMEQIDDVTVIGIKI
jgi:serine phosphatase RsbU (regulator of sigma subunit)